MSLGTGCVTEHVETSHETMRTSSNKPSCLRCLLTWWPCARRQLYEVLAHKLVVGRRLPVLLAANKSDAGIKAHTADFIRKRLERELCVSVALDLPLLRCRAAWYTKEQKQQHGLWRRPAQLKTECRQAIFPKPRHVLAAAPA